MGRLEKKRTEIQKAVKKPYAVLVILAIAALLILFAKVQDKQTGEGTSVLEDNKQNRTEAKENSQTPEGLVKDSSPAPEGMVKNSSPAPESMVKDSSQTPEGLVDGGSEVRPVTFDLEHAITVGESIHLSKNGDLEWQGKNRSS